jgi:hypothetical protein
VEPESVIHVPPGKEALITRCTATTLQTPGPATLAVQADIPRLILMADCTSAPSTVPYGAAKSHAFTPTPEAAALKDTVLLA